MDPNGCVLSKHYALKIQIPFRQTLKLSKHILIQIFIILKLSCLIVRGTPHPQ